MERWRSRERSKDLKWKSSRIAGVNNNANQQEKLAKSQVVQPSSRNSREAKRSSSSKIDQQTAPLLVPTVLVAECSSSSTEDNDNTVILRNRSPSPCRPTKSNRHLHRSHSVDHVQWNESSNEKALSQESLDSESGFNSSPMCNSDASSQTKSTSLPHPYPLPILINGSSFVKGGHRSPNLARRLKALVTLTPSKKSINFEKRHSEPNYLDHIDSSGNFSIACSSGIYGPSSHVNISPYFSQLDICCANKPSFRAFISAIHSAPRLRYAYRTVRKDRSRSRSRDPNFHRAEIPASSSSASVLTNFVLPAEEAVVYLIEDDDIKCNVDYEIFRVINYGRLLNDMKEDYESDTDDYNTIQRIIDRINDVTQEAFRIKEDAERQTKQRLGSVNCLQVDVATTLDLSENLPAERRNTVPNLAGGISAVLMKLRNGSKKVRSTSNASQRLQDFLPSYCGGFIFESEVTVTRLTKGKDKGKERLRMLTLFTDRILICKTSKEKVKDKSLIQEVWFSEVDNATGVSNEAIETNNSDTTLILGWPLINYSIRFENVEARSKWFDLLSQTIKMARDKLQSHSETINIKIGFDISSKDLSMSLTAVNCIGNGVGYSKSLNISSCDDVNSCLQRALFLFNIQECSTMSNMQLWAAFSDSSPIKLIGHELPYWIVLWSLRRQRNMSSSTTVGKNNLMHRQLSLSSEGSLDCTLSSSSLTSSQLSSGEKSSPPLDNKFDEQFRVKFMLRQKKDTQRSSNNSEFDDLNSSKGSSKSYSKSRNIFTNLLSLSARTKPEDSDSSSPPCTKKELRGQLFGRPLQEIYPHGQIGPSLMALLGIAYAHIPNMEGPFRVTGNIGQIKRLQKVLDNIDPVSDVDLTTLFETEINSQPSPATILGLIKKLINHIPDKLLQQSQLERWIEAWQQPTDQLRIKMIQALLAKLPPINVTLLELFVCLCDLVLKHAEITKLNAIGLSTSVAPSLLTPFISQNIEAQCEINELFAFIIDNFVNLWPNSDAHVVLETLKPNFSPDSSSTTNSVNVEVASTPATNSDPQHQENANEPAQVACNHETLEHNSLSAHSASMSPCNILEKSFKQDARQRPQPYHNLPLIRSTVTSIHSDLENFKPVIPRHRANQYRLLRPNSMVEDSLKNVTLRPQVPPSYQEALERQTKLRLTVTNQDHEESIMQKVPHKPRRCHSVDRRTLTRHTPPVQLTFKNGRSGFHQCSDRIQQPSPATLKSTNLYFQSSTTSAIASGDLLLSSQPHWLTVNSELNQTRSVNQPRDKVVKNISQSNSFRTRQLPNELKHVLKHEDESYV